MGSKAARIAPLLVALLSIGCGNPKPPVAVNAVLPSDLPIYEYKPVETSGPSIAVVVAKVRTQEEFAKRVEGKWETHWYIVTVDVIAVETGSWGPKEMRFVVKDHWPTPDSGITLKKLPWPYRAGVNFAFTIDTSAFPVRVLAQQRR